ncbi:MAG: hypothetical protein AMJ37_01705 [Dehalococcoidia bacterium DG_18]|nr:MAG: hypothetical protein AMJ37_01705 [Dehalococcoidia bacterium DG_18]
MSKLLDKLNQVSRGSPPPLGFRSAVAAPKSPRMVFIAVLAAGDAPAAAAAKENADAVLLSEAESTKFFEKLEKLVASLGELPWGVSLGEASEEQLSRLKSAGCDFLVCDAEKAPLMLLREEEMGRIVKVEPSLPDGLIRATAQLPIDVVLIGGEPSLSVQRLMVCQHLANLVHKPLVARAPLGMSSQDLKELWETGLAGVVVKVAGEAREGLLGLRQAIESLPLSRRRRGEKGEALLPYLGEEEEITEVEEEE